MDESDVIDLDSIPDTSPEPNTGQTSKTPEEMASVDTCGLSAKISKNPSNIGIAKLAAITQDVNDDLLTDQKLDLSWFSDEELYSKLTDRLAIFVCVCGCIFEDKNMYVVHKGAHDMEDPTKCRICGYKSKNWTDFMSHFLEHRHN